MKNQSSTARSLHSPFSIFSLSFATLWSWILLFFFTCLSLSHFLFLPLSVSFFSFFFFFLFCSTSSSNSFKSCVMPAVKIGTTLHLNLCVWHIQCNNAHTLISIPHTFVPSILWNSILEKWHQPFGSWIKSAPSAKREEWRANYYWWLVLMQLLLLLPATSLWIVDQEWTQAMGKIVLATMAKMGNSFLGNKKKKHHQHTHKHWIDMLLMNKSPELVLKDKHFSWQDVPIFFHFSFFVSLFWSSLLFQFYFEMDSFQWNIATTKAQVALENRCCEQQQKMYNICTKRYIYSAQECIRNKKGDLRHTAYDIPCIYSSPTLQKYSACMYMCVCVYFIGLYFIALPHENVVASFLCVQRALCASAPVF